MRTIAILSSVLLVSGSAFSQKGSVATQEASAAAKKATAPRPVDQSVSGALLICGGGRLPDSILERFVAAAGGKKARIVVIPTASIRADKGKDAIRNPFAKHGVAAVDVLHTRDRAVADSEAFVAPLLKASAVWIGGGSQQRLSTAYQGTRTETAIQAVLRRGGVVGGTSAGAAIQTAVMIASGKKAPKISTGLDLLPGCIVDQHFVARKRLPRLQLAVTANPTLVGLGIDEGTALLVRGRRVEVLGRSTVTVCMAASKTRKARVDQYRAGQRIDLVTLRNAARFRASGHDHAFAPSRPFVKSGTLMLVGGGRMRMDLWKRFVAAAGGKTAPFVVIPTAAGSTRSARGVVQVLRGMGANDVTVCHAADPKVVNSEAFLAPLRRAKGIWFGGGRQWRLVDAYTGTKALALFHGVLERGGVIAGSSAGTSIQAEFMVRGNPLGNREIAMEGYETGFGFLPGCAVDQHFSQRKRFDDMGRLLRRYPRLIGIGIDESTAIVVQRSRVEVMGRGNVFVYRDKTSTKLDRTETYDLLTGQKAKLKATPKTPPKAKTNRGH